MLHRIPALILTFLLLLPAPLVRAQTAPAAPVLAADAWILTDYATGQVLAEGNPDKRVEPASLTKVMTAYLTYSALHQGRIKPGQQVTISERAWRTQGSRTFLQVGSQATVDDLLKGMIIQSGNDASVALAETIGGSEDAFAQMMTRQAQALGMNNTRFLNASGYFDGPEPGHYSTARDLARLAAALIRDFPESHALHAAREYTFHGIRQFNRNRLLWLDPSADGLKTGHSQAAGYCLIGTARRDGRRLISVVLGAASDDARTQESLRLLNYGFLNFDPIRLYTRDQVVSRLKVFKGAEGRVRAGFTQDFVISLPRGVDMSRLRVQLSSRQPLLAPVHKGDAVGTLRVLLDDRAYGEYPVVALEDVDVAGIIGRAWDSLRLWFE
ncbi:MAG: D-alanyl-D-alanine carboxypeptidase [Proteobacteria bacterium]|nr:D-alanyl-D-alanine carboxypeptidase [Pseudomonadota bacterium]HQR03946.1 D-alanyl-D-alanine carboxypeptidase family protein [Rhodocyclaceae bacterium]